MSMIRVILRTFQAFECVCTQHFYPGTYIARYFAGKKGLAIVVPSIRFSGKTEYEKIGLAIFARDQLSKQSLPAHHDAYQYTKSPDYILHHIYKNADQHNTLRS
jgi:hypothetical protein